MRNRMSTIVALTMIIASWGLVFAVSFWPAYGQALSGDRAEQPCVREGIAKRGFPLARAKVFQRLDLTTEQQEEIRELRKQFRDNILRLRRGHRESLLNVLDEQQRRNLEEKRGENDRNLRDKSPRQWHRRPGPDSRPPDVNRRDPNKDDSTIDLNLLDVGSNKTLVDPTTWGNVKRSFRE